MKAGLTWTHQWIVNSRMIFRMGLKHIFCIISKNICDIKLSLIVNDIIFTRSVRSSCHGNRRLA